ncbi:MAG: DMT family transporter [Promethearchaeota archaeon]|nr:MAG: DMT family transporter [Candidatus Lokiarchaeota archaeon]
MVYTIEIIIGLVLGIIAYVSQYLGKGVQKFAIEGYKNRSKYSGKGKNTGIWIFGTILTSIFMFIQWIALLFAPINLIAPIEGLGLIVLVFFSYYVLKEPISKNQIFAVVLILSGIVLITLFNVNPSEISFNTLKIEMLVFLSVVVIVIELIIYSFSKYYNLRIVGFILGITAGTFVALQTASKRITAIPNSNLSIIFIIITFIMAIFSLIFTQYAFTKANANTVVPCSTSSSILLAIFIGVFSLSEQIVLHQIVGVVFLIGGIILLTGFSPKSEIERRKIENKMNRNYRS